MSLGSFLDPTEPLTVPSLNYLGVTDEYLADLSSTEFAMICPHDQDGAAGDDGVFTSNDLFTLNSASTDFVTQSIQVGDVVAVLDNKTNSVRVRGIFIAATVTTNAVTLRTRGPRVGFGAPPSPLGGQSNVRFRVPTARPQIAMSAAKFVRRYRLGVGQILGPTDFVPAVAYDALAELYFLASRQASLVTPTTVQTNAKDSLFAKGRAFEAARDEEIKILDATYNRDPELMTLSVGRLRIDSSSGRRCDEFGGY